MLTEVSNDLIKHFLHRADVNEYLKSSHIKKLYNSLTNSYVNSNVEIKQGFNEYPLSKFITNSLKNKIATHTDVLTLKWQTKGNYKVKNTLHIYLKDNLETPNTKLLVEAISYITSFSDKPRSINVHLCLLPDKKVFRKNSQRLTPSNINSGSNLFSDNNSEICIFRREECIKVIFHEIIHGLRFSKLGDNEMITERLCQKYNLETRDILLDESYTEIWAKLMNCFFVASMTNSQTKFQHFCTLVGAEKEFTLYQGNKIKAFIKKSRDKDIDSETNTTAYFLVCGEIFSNLDDFLMNCQINPYVRDHQKCLEYLYELNILDKRKVSVNDKYYNTLRMSVTELEV